MSDSPLHNITCGSVTVCSQGVKGLLLGVVYTYIKWTQSVTINTNTNTISNNNKVQTCYFSSRVRLHHLPCLIRFMRSRFLGHFWYLYKALRLALIAPTL